jgi:hypothetical protein
MNFTVLGPNDNPLSSDQSTPTDSRFGGHREHSKTAKAQDYTSRTGKSENKKENPVEETVRDIDDMANSEERKSEFSYQEKKINVQANNEADFITASDSDRRPRMDEGTDAVQVPDTSELKQQKKANKWQFDTSNRYEGEIS